MAGASGLFAALNPLDVEVDIAVEIVYVVVLALGPGKGLFLPLLSELALQPLNHGSRVSGRGRFEAPFLVL